MNSDTSLTDEEALAIAKAATPGEWRLESGDHTHRYAIVMDADDRTITYKYGAGSKKDSDQDEADFRHIATFNPAYVTSLIERAQAAEAQAELAGGIAERLAIERNDLRRQRDDLHEANNGYLARARTAEEALKPALLVLCAMPQDNLNAAFRADIDHAIKAIRALSPTRTEGDQTLSENTKKEA